MNGFCYHIAIASTILRSIALLYKYKIENELVSELMEISNCSEWSVEM